MAVKTLLGKTRTVNPTITPQQQIVMRRELWEFCAVWSLVLIFAALWLIKIL